MANPNAQKSLYSNIDNADMITRINKLKPTATANWGKMSVAQMLAHCQVLFKITYNEVHLSRGLLGFLFGPMIKKKLLNAKSLDRNLPTFGAAKIKDARDFETEKALLINYVSRMATAGPNVITKSPHPFFGPLTIAEWDMLHYAHLDHHLKQFGV